MASHIRVKRKNQTVFLMVEPTDKFDKIMKAISDLQGIDPSQLQLLAKDKTTVYAREATLGDQQVETDDVIYACHQANGVWEKVAVQNLSGEAE